MRMSEDCHDKNINNNNNRNNDKNNNSYNPLTSRRTDGGRHGGGRKLKLWPQNKNYIYAFQIKNLL